MRILLLLLFSIPAQARVFNLQNETFAPYFRGTIGMSSVGQSPYAHSSGALTSFDEDVEYNYTGEAGFLFTTKVVGFTLGIEFLTTEKASPTGSSSSGVEWMSLESKIKGTFLKAGFIINHSSPSTAFRSYTGINAGFGNLKMLNDYELTADGTTQYGLTEISEKATSETYFAEITMGFEFNVAKASTMIVEGGYRYLKADEWEYSGSGTNFLGAYNDGDQVLNHDGTKRQVNLSNWFLGVGFRIYID
jgi:hypothetical protein